MAELVEELKLEIIAESEDCLEKLDVTPVQYFTDSNRLRKTEEFKTRQANRREAFSDANTLCKNVVKNNRGFSRGRR